MTSINYKERGSGYPIILLHGFPFNLSIWDDFANQLAKSFRVFTVDLPGFGKSPILKTPFTINDVAQELASWLEDLKLEKVVMVGHSLGGYVGLSMTKIIPEKISGLVLFHSTAYADSDEKKENRNKVLEFIAKNGVESFTSNFIPPLFADPKHPSIDKVRTIAKHSNEHAVINYTKAMRDRVDTTDVLKSFHKPIMIISGEKDGGITVESVKKQAELSSFIELHVLMNTAHMAMFESEIETIDLIKNFTDKSNRH